MSRTLRFLAAIALLPVLLAAEDRLVIISPHWEGVEVEVTRSFRRWYAERFKTDVRLEWLDQGGTSDDLKLVESLFKKHPAGIDIDVFFGGGMDPYMRLKEKGFLEPYKVAPEILKAVPAACAGIPNYDPEYHWYGVVLSSFGILYNRRVLDWMGLPTPATWEDLCRPEYATWVGLADPRHSGSIHMMYEIILQAYGWDRGWRIILETAGNAPRFTKSASQVAKDTSAGEVAVSLCIDSYALAQIDVNGGENMGFVLPRGATIINPDAVGILRGGPNPVAARRFIDFLLSYEGQLLWMSRKNVPWGPVEFSLNRLSIRPDAYADPNVSFRGLNPYDSPDSLPYDADLASGRWALLNDLMGAFAIDSHRDLRAAWTPIRSRRAGSLRRRFGEAPIERGLQTFYIRSWSDPAFRNRQTTRWLETARRRFRGILFESRL